VSDPSPYDAIARLYDPWSASVTEDIDFYVEEALAAGEPVVELACGTGRIAVPIAQAGVRVIGIDGSPAMLDVARERARAAGGGGVGGRRQGEHRVPPGSRSSSTCAKATSASRRSPSESSSSSSRSARSST
jgi:SAM-dependent methyltransferase